MYVEDELHKGKGIHKDTIVGKQYLPMISDWYRAPKNTWVSGYWGYDGGNCDNDVHEIFKCMGEVALTSAYFHLRPDNTYIHWNCSVEKQGDKWKVTPSEQCVNKIYTNTDVITGSSISIIKIRDHSVGNVSKIIAETDWKTKQIAKNVVFKQAQVEIFDAPQSISMLTISKNASARLGIKDVSDTRITTSALCKQVDAIAGVNASFFDMENGNSVDFVRVNGTVLHKTRKNYFNNAALAIDKDGVRILGRDTTDVDWENNIDCENVVVAGPLIMKNGMSALLQADQYVHDRHPRTFVAIKADKSVLLVVVDGRNANAAGMSINELYILAKALGCEDAMNFDGGGSSTMYIRGEDGNGVVNYPCDNKLFDHNGERRVANAIYVKISQRQL
jgi:exopolysaccharide biosynthesis protein